jgi:phosphatidylinositol alpha-1,6-mannosyltransferase
MGSDRLRIAFVAQGFPPELGGRHVYNAEYARRLAGRGHELRVLTWETGAEGVAASDAALPFEVYRERLDRSRGPIDPQGVEDALARWRSQVAFVSGGCRAVSRVVHAAVRRAPVVVSVHDLRDKGRARGRLRRWSARRRYGFERAARLTANSEYTRSLLLRLGVPAAKIEVVYPGVDTRRFLPDAEAGARLRRELGLADRRILLTVSRLAPNKGHARVIQALPRLREEIPQLVYAIVGSGGMRKALERCAEQLGVADRVLFAERVPDVRAWYNACDVFVMASTATGRGLKAGEGFGMAYAEAGACGKPVVASTSGGGAEVVVDGETGRIVDAEDDDALLEALRELLAGPDRARALGEKARERVQRFDWSRGAAELDRVLREAAAL